MATPSEDNSGSPQTRWLRSTLAIGLILFWAVETHFDIYSKDLDIPWEVNIAAGLGLLYFFSPEAERLAGLFKRWKKGEPDG